MSENRVIIVEEGDLKRFFSFVDKLPNGCWYWMGARSRGKGNRKWYGSFSIKGLTIRAHRFSLEYFKKLYCPRGYHRDHTCRFSMCVNPDHLEIITHEENERRKKNGQGSSKVSQQGRAGDSTSGGLDR